MKTTLTLILTYICQDQDGGDIINEVIQTIISTMSIQHESHTGTGVVEYPCVPRACALLLRQIYTSKLSCAKELKLI